MQSGGSSSWRIFQQEEMNRNQLSSFSPSFILPCWWQPSIPSWAVGTRQNRLSVRQSGSRVMTSYLIAVIAYSKTARMGLFVTWVHLKIRTLRRTTKMTLRPVARLHYATQAGQKERVATLAAARISASSTKKHNENTVVLRLTYNTSI